MKQQKTRRRKLNLYLDWQYCVLCFCFPFHTYMHTNTDITLSFPHLPTHLHTWAQNVNLTEYTGYFACFLVSLSFSSVFHGDREQLVIINYMCSSFIQLVNSNFSLVICYSIICYFLNFLQDLIFSYLDTCFYSLLSLHCVRASVYSLCFKLMR